MDKWSTICSNEYGYRWSKPGMRYDDGSWSISPSDLRDGNYEFFYNGSPIIKIESPFWVNNTKGGGVLTRITLLSKDLPTILVNVDEIMDISDCRDEKLKNILS